MKNYSYILLILVLFTFVTGFGQEIYTIKGIIVDPAGKKVKEANVVLGGNSKKNVRSDSTGYFEIELSYTSPTELVINHVSYKQDKTLIHKSLLRKSKNNILKLTVNLEYQTLNEVIIRGKSIPDTVFSSDLTSVSDYEFIEDQMVLLSYSKSLNKNAFIQLTSKRNKLITTYKTPPNPKRLFKDFEGNIYLITEYKVFFNQYF